MTTYILFRDLEVEGTNALGTFTHGGISPTAILGFAHNFSRKYNDLVEDEKYLRVNGVGIVVHNVQHHRFRENFYKDYRYSQTRNPVGKDGKSLPFQEKGKMNINLSLVIEIDESVSVGGKFKNKFKDFIENTLHRLRIASGTIVSFREIDFINEDEYQKNKYKLVPGFALIHRKDIAEEILSSADDPIENYIQYFCLKKGSKIIPKNESVKEIIDEKSNKEEKVIWETEKRKHDGKIIPLEIGHMAISELFPPGEIKNSRDNDYPFRFVEPVLSVGEWRSPLRFNNFSEFIWKYEFDDKYYLATTKELNQGDING